MGTDEQAAMPRIDLPPFSECVREVIRDIVPETVCVFRPDDDPLHQGADCPSAEPRLAVSIREWLQVSCKTIRWERRWKKEMPPEPDAQYQTNGKFVLWPANACVIPDGPNCFKSRVIVNQDFPPTAEDDPKGKLLVKHLIAHELVHVLHAMKYIVPAFSDWETFWKVFLGGGAKCKLLQACWKKAGEDFDQKKGTPAELAELERYWPSSQVKEWVKARRSWGSERPSGNSD